VSYKVGFFLKHLVRGVSMLISIENNLVPFDETGRYCFPLQNIHTFSKLVDFSHGNKSNLIQSKLNLTKKINHCGQWFVSPGRDFHSSDTPETFQRKEKTVNNQKIKKSCLTLSF